MSADNLRCFGPRAALAWAMLASTMLSGAAAAESRPADGLCNDCAALSTEELDSARGGLMLPSGLEVMFGLERSVFVNGQLEAFTTLNAAFSSGELTALDLQRSASNTIQIGENNILSPVTMESMQGGFGSIIQNSADQQLIQNITAIDIIVRNIDFQSTAPAVNNGALQGLIIDSLR